MNSLLSNNNIKLQALKAMLSGQSPQKFLMKLAKNNPLMQDLDFTNLEKTANELCQKSGKDINQAKSEITQEFANLI